MKLEVHLNSNSRHQTIEDMNINIQSTMNIRKHDFIFITALQTLFFSHFDTSKL